MWEYKAEDIKPGIYKHFKGNTYRVIGTIYDADSNQNKVMYRSEWDGMLYCRSPYEWMKPVEVDNGIIERFVFIRD
jgi:hypothetical protein